MANERILTVEPITEYRLKTKELRRAREEAGLSKQKMADRLSWVGSLDNYRRLENCKKEFVQLSRAGIESIVVALGGFEISTS